MAETKTERLGLRGRLAYFDSILRLLGGANTTGAIATAAAFHAFSDTPDVQNSVKWAAALFLGGIVTFAIGYMGLVLATLDIDHSLHSKDEPTWPDYLWWVPTKTAEEYKTEAKREYVVAMFGGLASFVFFMVGLFAIVTLAMQQLT